MIPEAKTKIDLDGLKAQIKEELRTELLKELKVSPKNNFTYEKGIYDTEVDWDNREEIDEEDLWYCEYGYSNRIIFKKNFSKTPEVVISLSAFIEIGDIYIHAENIDKSGFDLRIESNDDLDDADTQFTIEWLAIGN